MGTVTAVTDSAITLKTVKGDTVTISFDQDTKFLKARTKAQSNELQVGDRAVIDLQETNGKVYAKQVRFAAGKKASHEGEDSDKPNGSKH